MSDIVTTVRRARNAYTALAPFGRPHRRHLVTGALATLVLVACRLAFPWPLRGLMEIVFHGGNHGNGAAVAALVPRAGDPVWWLVGSFVAIILLWGLSESLQRLSFTRFAVGLVRDSRAAALARIPAAGDREPGDLISAVTGDAARVKSGVKIILIGTSRNGAFFVGVTIIVGLISPLIGCIFLAGGIATFLVGSIGAWRTSRIVQRSRKRESGFTDDLHRYFSGRAELPNPAGDPERPPDSKVTRVEGITTFAVHAVLAASTCAILILSIDAGRSGRLSAGSVFTILAYVLLMHNKTVGFGRRIIRGGRLLPSAERLATLAIPPARDPSPGTTPESIGPRVDSALGA
jgi:ABC-type multidrug transport system fused ATPase/permease subunit